jgi:hypothetical protein
MAFGHVKLRQQTELLGTYVQPAVPAKVTGKVKPEAKVGNLQMELKCYDISHQEYHTFPRKVHTVTAAG